MPRCVSAGQAGVYEEVNCDLRQDPSPLGETNSTALPTSIPGGLPVLSLRCLQTWFRQCGGHKRPKGAARSGSKGGIRRGLGVKEVGLQN